MEVGKIQRETKMATSTFAKKIVINTDQAAEALIKGLQLRHSTPKVVHTTTCKVASKEELAKKNSCR